MKSYQFHKVETYRTATDPLASENVGSSYGRHIAYTGGDGPKKELDIGQLGTAPAIAQQFPCCRADCRAGLRQVKGDNECYRCRGISE
jgi:hypothetical protein